MSQRVAHTITGLHPQGSVRPIAPYRYDAL